MKVYILYNSYCLEPEKTVVLLITFRTEGVALQVKGKVPVVVPMGKQAAVIMLHWTEMQSKLQHQHQYQHQHQHQQHQQTKTNKGKTGARYYVAVGRDEI